MQNNVLSVRQLNFYVRSLLESDMRLCDILVEGEISNFKNHYSSGHLYFTLKDPDAAIRCVMFKGNAIRLKFKPEDGLRVVLRGRASVYEKDGQYQFYAEEMSVAGLGDIALQFEQIKERLEKEGMLDPDSKRALPRFPKNIAVVTSDTGAAVRDIMNILNRRWPIAKVIMCPVAVQGEFAVGSMIDALDRIYEGNFADLIIIGRGGGSVEDLWAFNSEQLARKIFESPIPVISAVGHETDFTICDFVADLRAPTPSAAAELAVPDISEIDLLFKNYTENLKNQLIGKYNLSSVKFERLSENLYFKKPVDAFINQRMENIDRSFEKLQGLLNDKIKDANFSLAKACTALDNLSPLKTLSRGYATVELNGKIINSVSMIKPDDELSLNFTDGSAVCKVKDIRR